jgi:hypothetical protein
MGRVALFAVVALLAAAPAAAARDAVVTSFDGTPIQVTLHPAGGAGAGERPASGLPFTGQDLFAITAAGVLLLGLGVFLRRLTPSEEA